MGGTALDKKKAGEDAAAIAKHWPFAQRMPQRVVVKVGSNVLALASGGLDVARVASLCAQVGKAHAKGVEVIVVTSGAVAAGRGVLRMAQRPATLPDLQAVAAIGQGALMEAYTNELRRHGLFAAQMLLTRDDMDDRRRYLNMRLTLASLLKRPVVPIINENDVVTVDELKFGDNDMLSAMVAAKMDADLLVILSNVAGLMTGNPGKDPDAKLVPVVKKMTGEVAALAYAGQSSFGVGGMSSKLDAARHATRFGVACVMADGCSEGVVSRVLSGKFSGTLFLPSGTRKAGTSRKHWIGSRRARGTITIDRGAEKALVSKRRSLLAVGVRRIDGTFGKGDVIAIANEGGDVLAQGIVNYSSEQLHVIAGQRSENLPELLGEATYEEVVHVDNLALA